MKKFILLFLPLIGFASLPPEIPYTNKGLIFFPCNFDNQDQKLFNAFADTVLGNIFKFHSYSVNVYKDPDPGAPGLIKILPTFITQLSSGIYGFICIYTHGTQNWIAVEYFPPEEGEKCEREG
ncbi:MAG: hypothetical protein ABIM29_02875 [candidate division WOR-3 bacterium]